MLSSLSFDLILRDVSLSPGRSWEVWVYGNGFGEGADCKRGKLEGERHGVWW